jgi:hypothetical protein
MRPDKPQKNVIGAAALFCAMAAAALILVSGVTAAHLRHLELGAIKESGTQSEGYNGDPASSEVRAINDRLQTRLREIREGNTWFTILAKAVFPAMALTVAAIGFGIVGVTEKRARKGAALAGLLFGIGDALVLLLLMSACG